MKNFFAIMLFLVISTCIGFAMVPEFDDTGPPTYEQTIDNYEFEMPAIEAVMIIDFETGDINWVKKGHVSDVKENSLDHKLLNTDYTETIIDESEVLTGYLLLCDESFYNLTESSPTRIWYSFYQSCT